MNRRPLRCLLLAATAGAAAAAGVAPAVAAITDNMYLTANFQATCAQGGHFCETDNGVLTVYREGSLSSSGKANIRDTLDNSFDATHLTVSYSAEPVYTGSAETDIIYQTNAARVPSGLEGLTWCDNPVSDTRLGCMTTPVLSRWLGSTNAEAINATY